MIPFLLNIAENYYKTYKQNVSRFAFVFPNRRAGLFFQRYLSQTAKQPIFSPRILTITDLFQQLSSYRKADRIQMLFMLYDIYKEKGGLRETFDDFLYWGEMLLGDFDDVDKYMVDARQLFTNISDLKEIDSGYGFLSSAQIEAIRRFWADFLPVGDNDKKKDFLEMWEVLYPLYANLREKLHLKGLAYDGMIMREVAEKAQKNEEFALPYEKIVFVGFNVLSKTEEILFKYLKNIGLADFYWDYSSSLVRDGNNKASLFISKNKIQFPSQLSLSPEDLTMDLPKIEVIGIPSAVGQAKYVHTIVKDLLNEQQTFADKAINTAIVLPDENLLLPVLYSIPEEIEKINVTMGYGLRNSSISGLIDLIFELQRSLRKSGDGFGYYFRPVLSILNHRYIMQIAPEETNILKQDILKYNKIIVPLKDFHSHPLLQNIFTPIEKWQDVSEYLKKILTLLRTGLFTHQKEDKESETENIKSIDIEAEFIIEYYKTINRLQEVLKNIEVEMSVDIYFRLLKKLVAGISIPFSGEPLAGLQVMGVLETRVIDFDNLIILSMNEGVFPQKRSAGSFIPHNLRKGFDMPVFEHQDSVFAYNFYRMINRAKRVYLLYDTRTDGMQTGEVSRYFTQIKHLYSDKFNIKEKLAIYKISASEGPAISITKSKHVLEKLNAFLTAERSLSASAINTYLNCPLQFYLSIVEKIEEEEEVEETIEASTFGTIFHSIMEWIYKRFEGKMVTAEALHKIEKDDTELTAIIEKSFAENYFKTDKVKKLTGQNFLTGEVIRKYVKKVLATDAGLTPFIYIESEKRIVKNYILPSGKTVSLKSFIDRVDEVKGHTRIIDYKTGRGVLRFKDMKDLFDKDMKDRPKAVMQVFMYAHLYLLENPDKIMEPGIYYLRNLFGNSRFEPDVVYCSERVTDFSLYRNDFKALFDKCLDEIFDPAIPFNQTTTDEACKWCLFANICRK